MAVGLCLPPQVVDAFKRSLVSGEINPDRLANMSSEERHAYLEKYVGKEHSQWVNAQFESKLLLKNQQRGFVSWAQKVAGLKPQLKTDLLSRISRMDKVLNPEDKQAFLKDLASTKLGVHVTQEEAKTITDLSKALESAGVHKAEDGTFKSMDQRLAYGRAHFDLAQYVQNLKDNAEKLGPGDVYKHPIDSAKKLANVSRSFKTIGDLSIAFRNGFKLLATHPKIWSKSFKGSVAAMFKTLGGKDAWREIQAYVRSSPYYNDMVKADLLPKSEEAYPISIPERIPVAGRLAKATQVGYEAMAQMMRVDTYSTVIKGAERAGVDIRDTQFKKDLGKFVGMLTNRGSVGKLEPAANTINAFLFSPRALASTLHLATDWARLDYHPYIRKQATAAVLKTGALIAGTMAIAEALHPGSVELDPRSSNFGKVKVGNVTFDISGGMSSLATLGARLYTGSSKSATTGKITSLTSGAYGSPTRFDEVVNFFVNKAAPAPTAIANQLRGKNAVGEPVTIGNQLTSTLTPLGIETLQNAIKDKNPSNPNPYITMLLDDIGITASVNSANGSNGKPSWDTSTSKELTQFKSRVGNATFEKAAQQYDTRYAAWLNNIKSNQQYQNMDPTEQQALLTAEKTKIKSQIFKENGFKYKIDRSKSRQLKSLL